jgi:energy-coupling factor transport system permease protein
MKKNNIDPRTKLVIVLILSTFALIYNDISTLLLILTLSIIIGILMKSNLITIIKRLRKVIGILLAIAIIQSIFISEGTPILRVGSIKILTDYGIFKSLEFILRFSIIISSSAILSTSTSREIVQALVQLHIPYEIAFMVSIAIRFLPVFKDEMSDMIIAIQLRGIDLKKIKFTEKIKVYRYILLPAMTNSIMKAKELSAAMEMRGFRAYPERTSYNILIMKRIDYIILSFSLLSTLMFVFFIR